MCNDYDNPPKQKKYKIGNIGKKLDTRQTTNKVVAIVVPPTPPTAEINTYKPNNEAQVMVTPTNVQVSPLIPP